MNSQDEDLKFLFYCNGQTFTENTDLDLTIQQLFTLYDEEFNIKKLAEFKRLRKVPIVPKNVFSLINTLCYINIVKDMLLTGSLKNKDSIDKYTVILQEKGIKFDPEFLLLEIRGGLITSIDNAEGLDKLYCEQVLANKEYFICSGLRDHYEKVDLLNNTYLFILNIKKAKFRTLESEGMICCTEENGKIETLKVDENNKELLAGKRIELENHFTIFSDLLYGKVDLNKNAFKTILSDYFKVIDNHLTFKGTKVLLNGKYVVTKTVNGPVR